MRYAALLGATLLALAGPAGAQEVSVMLGGVTARYADSISGTASLVSTRFAVTSASSAAAMTAGIAKFTAGEWVAQVSAQGTALAKISSGLRLGIAGGGAANRSEGAVWAGQMTAGPVLVAATGGLLLSGGVAAGALRSIDDSSMGTLAANARLHGQVGRSVGLSAGVTGVAADTIRYADVTAEISYQSGRIDASLVAGFRRGDLEDDPWAQARLEYTLLPRVAVEAGLGRYPRDLVGFTDGRFAIVGARLAITPRAGSRSAARSPVQVERVDGGLVRLAFTIEQQAERLEIAGDWNGWDPLPLQRDGKRWWVELLLDPGIHRYALVVDGETWTVPDGVPVEPDDFGGQVALLVVH